MWSKFDEPTHSVDLNAGVAGDKSAAQTFRNEIVYICTKYVFWFACGGVLRQWECAVSYHHYCHADMRIQKYYEAEIDRLSSARRVLCQSFIDLETHRWGTNTRENKRKKRLALFAAGAGRQTDGIMLTALYIIYEIGVSMWCVHVCKSVCVIPPVFSPVVVLSSYNIRLTLCQSLESVRETPQWIDSLLVCSIRLKTTIRCYYWVGLTLCKVNSSVPK